MKYCRNCGAEIDERAVICPKCGVPQEITYVKPDTGGFAWGLLGFFVPLAGLVLFLAWKDERPNTAKAVGIGALISVGASLALAGLYFLIFAVGTASLFLML